MAGFLKRIFPYIPALLRLTAYFVKRDRDKCKEIMKVHLEEGEQKITLVNPAAWQILGFEREDQCLHKSLNDDRNECEFRAADGKGGYRRLHALQQCLRSADGSHLLQITLTDITLQYQIIEQRRTWHE